MKSAQHPLEPTAPSALVISRLFRFVGRLVQSGGPTPPGAAAQLFRWAAKSQLAFHVIIRSTASKQCVKGDFEEH